MGVGSCKLDLLTTSIYSITFRHFVNEENFDKIFFCKNCVSKILEIKLRKIKTVLKLKVIRNGTNEIK